MRFENRGQAGLLLGQLLLQKHGIKDAVVIGIARGGMSVAKCISDLLSFSLDTIVVKKIGASGNPELALGAVGPQNTVYLDKKLIASFEINKTRLNELLRQKEKERREKEKQIRIYKKRIPLEDKKIILVDDGIATGATTIAAIKSLRKQHPKEIILVVPVISESAFDLLMPLVKEIVPLFVDPSLSSVGAYYNDFSEVTDEEVEELFRK